MNPSKKLHRTRFFPTRGEANIITTLRDLGRATAREIAKASGVDISTCYNGLRRLEKGGIVRSNPVKREGRYVAEYELTERGDKFANGLSHFFE